jgi:8-oxo-dGTP pyrophosphatase MutT (NUDIX family)
MGGHTANAGRVYPPGGSLDPRDVLADGRVDVVRSIELELEEETGLRAEDAEAGAMVAIPDGARLSFGRIFRFPQSADRLAGSIRANLDRQEHRELADVVIIRSAAEAAAAGGVPYAQVVADAYFGGQIFAE